MDGLLHDKIAIPAIRLAYLNRGNLVIYGRNECIKEFRIGRFFLLYEILKSF